MLSVAIRDNRPIKWNQVSTIYKQILFLEFIAYIFFFAQVCYCFWVK